MKLFSLKNIAILQLFLFVIYNLQGSLYQTGGVVSQSILLITLAIGVLFGVKCLLFKQKDAFFVMWTIFLLINSFYYLLGADNSHFNAIKNILTCSMGFFPFYYLGRKGYTFDKEFVCFVLIMTIVSIFTFYTEEQNTLLNVLNADKNRIVNNAAYNFVLLIPFLLFFKKRIVLQIGVLLLIVFFIIQGAKRGAIITGGVGCLIFLYYFFKKNPSRGLFKSFILISAIGTIGYYSYIIFKKNEYLISRMLSLAEGDSSGRDFIYKRIFNAWWESDKATNVFLGYGFAASARITGGVYAHNDWLEALSNFGVMGVILYLSFFIILVKIYLSNTLNFRDRMVLLVVSTIWFTTSLFSMWYTSQGSFTQSLLLGYILGSRNYSLKHKNTIK